MKYYGLVWLLVFSSMAMGQSLIHAHNDYQQPEPLRNALRYKVFSVEADVYLYNDKLLVAHDKKELPAAPSLDSLYLQPIIRLFREHGGHISTASLYAPVLMIDIKEKGEAVIQKLLSTLLPYRCVFDRTINKMAVQVVISGDRGPAYLWPLSAPMLFFDGRPNEVYNKAMLERVAFISDSYANYHNNANDIKQAAGKIHSMNKLFRLWGYPDTVTMWQQMQQCGVDILNTDKVAECRQLFN